MNIQIGDKIKLKSHAWLIRHDLATYNNEYIIVAITERGIGLKDILNGAVFTKFN